VHLNTYFAEFIMHFGAQFAKFLVHPDAQIGHVKPRGVI